MNCRKENRLWTYVLYHKAKPWIQQFVLDSFESFIGCLRLLLWWLESCWSGRDLAELIFGLVKDENDWFSTLRSVCLNILRWWFSWILRMCHCTWRRLDLKGKFASPSHWRRELVENMEVLFISSQCQGFGKFQHFSTGCRFSLTVWNDESTWRTNSIWIQE